MPCIVIQYFLWVACGGGVALRGSLIEILFKVAELKQERNWRRVTNEVNGIDVADDLHISLQLTGRPAVSELNYAGLITSQKNIRTFRYSCH